MKKLFGLLLFSVSFSCLQAEESSERKPSHVDSIHSSWECITPSAQKCPSSNSPYVTLEFLYLQTYEDDLVFTESRAFLDIPLPLNIFTTNLPAVDFDWNPAFRISMGYNLPYDGWDCQLNWMYHHTSPETTVVSNQPNLALLITADQGSDPVIESDPLATKAVEKFTLNYNAIVVELGRHYFISSAISLRPCFGIKGAFINQSLHVRYDDMFIVSPAGIGPFAGNQTYKGKGNFRGVGPRIGIHTKWYIGWGLNLFANTSGTLFGGNFHANATIVNFDDPRSTSEIIQKIKKDSRFLVRPNVDVQVGFEWGKCYFDNYTVDFSIGYELQYFWNQMHIPYPGLLFSTGDLSFHGLSAAFRVDF